MSDNEDLLGDDLGDQSLADYNLGNEEEDQLLADDYESGASQNVPSSISSYEERVETAPPDYSRHDLPYTNQRIHYQMQPDTECVVPNITVEVPNVVDRSTYAPYEPPPVFQEHAVPPAIPAAPMEAPQMVPSEMAGPLSAGAEAGPRPRFVSERPPGSQRAPQVRDIPDSLDKVVVPRGGWSRGRSVWRNPHYARHNYRRARGNFNQRPPYPSPQKVRPNSPQIRPDIRPNPAPIRPDIRPDLPPNIRPDLPIRPEIHPELRLDIPPEVRPDILPDIRPDLPSIRPDFNPDLPNIPPLGPDMPAEPLMSNIPLEPPFRPMDGPIRPSFQRFPDQFRPNLGEQRPFNPNLRPSFEPFPYQRPFRPFLPMREVTPNINQIPQVTIRHAIPNPLGLPPKQEVRMLPVQLPPNLPPGGLQGKKVLINPHFKGNFQPPVEGPVNDIDDAAERFIAEQRSALARAAGRKFQPPRSPHRFIENTTIEIENELARGGRRGDDEELLRRQEEFIHANRAGLRRRMRSVSPPRRSLSPRRSPERARPRLDASRPQPDEDSEYRRRMREQEALRERVMRAKEARRRKNAVLHRATHDRERERLEKEKEKEPPKEVKPEPEPTSTEPDRPDTTRTSPDKLPEEKEPSPVKKEEVEVNSTCETLTPPRSLSPRALTPPLPAPLDKDKRTDSDDDLDLILGDIDGILSDDDDSGRFKEKPKKCDPPKPAAVDLRTKLPPKPAEKKPPRQKIVFHEEKEEKKRKDKSPVRRTAVTSSTKATDTVEKKPIKVKEKTETVTTKDKSRPRITFDNKEPEKQNEDTKPQFPNRRVILHRKISQKTNEKSIFARIEVKSDASKPNPGIFSRAVRTAIAGDSRIVVKKQEEPQVEYATDSDIDEERLLEEDSNTAVVTNLPHGMTDTRLKTLAGTDVQNLSLDKEERTAKITFKTTVAAENFKKKFNNKMVAASRLTVTLK